jgi:hypothetical protein
MPCPTFFMSAAARVWLLATMLVVVLAFAAHGEPLQRPGHAGRGDWRAVIRSGITVLRSADIEVCQIVTVLTLFGDTSGRADVVVYKESCAHGDKS